MGIEKLRYDGKTVVVSGGASGIGEATVALLLELGAEVHVWDIKPSTLAVTNSRILDVRDLEGTRAALAELDAPIASLFACAGVAGPPFAPLDVMEINFLGARHLIEQAEPLLAPGASIAVISSVGGFRFAEQIDTLNDLLATPDYAAGVAWCEANAVGAPEDADEMSMANYSLSKSALNVYVLTRALELFRRGFRINAVAPGPTMTPLVQATPAWLSFTEEVFERTMGGSAATPEDQAYPLCFLNSEAARYVNGQVLYVEGGYLSAAQMGQVETFLANPITTT